jgi:ketosteroid isomerase-like protein
MSDLTERNLALVDQWETLYNADVERMVKELYAPDAAFSGHVWGQERFLRFELKVLAAAPKRQLRVLRKHPSGDAVTVEGEMLDEAQGADWKLPFCAVLTFRDGKVVSDNTYTEYSKFPGFG